MSYLSPNPELERMKAELEEGAKGYMLPDDDSDL